MIAERPMRVATVRVFGVFLVMLSVSIVLSRMIEWRTATNDTRFDLMVGQEIVAMLIAAAVAIAMFIGGWIVLRNPAVATRRVIAVVIITVAASLALGMRGLEPPSTAALTPRQREAFEYLRSSTSLEMRSIGFFNVRSLGYLAMCILRRSAAADEAFQELTRSGTIAGQVYGLCGLYHTDPLAFSAALPRYRRSTDYVGVSSGCVTEGRSVADVACAEGTLHSLRVSRREFEKQHGKIIDICGGSIPAMYGERDPDETAARIDEKLAEFRR